MPFNYTRKKRPLNTASQKEMDKWMISEGQAKLFKDWTATLKKNEKQNQRESDAC
jgi:peroxiredoxin family protein